LQEIKCPHCGSKRLFKDGKRKLSDGSKVQRYLCRDCGYRFTDPRVRQTLKAHSGISFNAGEMLRALKLEVEEEKSESGPQTRETTVPLSEMTVRGKIIEFLWWMKKQGYADETIKSRSEILTRLMRMGADLFNPESVKAIIAEEDGWSPSRKANVVRAYSLFARWAGIKWSPPKITVPEKIPFIPLEREIDDLIAGCSKHIAAALQIMKETGARSGEVYRLRWSDVDFGNMKIRINNPKKKSHARIFKISSKLLGMLNSLPREGEYIFSRYSSVRNMRSVFARQRRRIAHKLGNPRLQQITFHTLRHWKATMEYAKTKDILHVMRVLGHKNIKNTIKYTQLVDFQDEEYIVKVAATKDEIIKLLEAGFKYECTNQNGLLYFRKRK